MIIRYVNTASTPGGDGTTNNTAGATRAYASLAEALAPLHLSTLADHWQIYCSGATADDGTGGGSTTDHTAFEFYTSPTNYMEIFGDNTTGKWNTNAYRIEVTNRSAIYNQYAAHIRLYNIQTQVKITDAGVYNGQRLATANNDTSLGTGYELFKGCISRVDPTSTNGQLYCFDDSIIGTGSGTCDHVNCLAIGLVGTTAGTGFVDDASSGKFYWNCTAANCQYGFDVADTCKNCLTTACTFGWISNGVNSDYNATDDGNGVPHGTHNRSGVTYTFIDAANGDYHLASTDAGAKGYGLTDPASGLYSDDIDGQIRTGSWDIGADEYIVVEVVSGSDFRPRFGLAPNRNPFKRRLLRASPSIIGPNDSNTSPAPITDDGQSHSRFGWSPSNRPMVRKHLRASAPGPAVAAAAPSTIVFRKTLSSIGTKTGSRQGHNT